MHSPVYDVAVAKGCYSIKAFFTPEYTEQS